VEYRPNTNTAVLWRYEREKVKERIWEGEYGW
jgi:hypothetical protein